MTKEKYPPPRVWLNIEICRAIYKAYKEAAQNAAIEVLTRDFDSRYPGILEGILGSVQYKADKLNFDLKTTAAYYFVHLAKSQCFIDGNKRLAVVLTNVFLRINDYELKIQPSTLRDLAIIIAKNKSLSIEYAAEQIDELFHLTKIGGMEDL